MPDHRANIVAVARALAVDRTTAEVVTGLDAAGVPSVLLKGPVLTKALYDDAAARTYADTDVLVPARLIRRAEGALAELGFAGPSRDAYRGRWAPSGLEHVRASDRASVDLHVTVHGATAPADDVWDVLDGETEPMTLAGARVRVLRPGALAYLVAAHAAHHGASVAKPLRDLGRGLERWPEATWAAAATVAERLGGRAALDEGLRLVPGGVELARRLGVEADPSLDTVLAALSPPVSAMGWQRVLSARGARAKSRMLVRELVPSPRYMRTWDPAIGASRGALALAYARRLGRLTRELPAALTALRTARTRLREREGGR